MLAFSFPSWRIDAAHTFPVHSDSLQSANICGVALDERVDTLPPRSRNRVPPSDVKGSPRYSPPPHHRCSTAHTQAPLGSAPRLDSEKHAPSPVDFHTSPDSTFPIFCPASSIDFQDTKPAFHSPHQKLNFIFHAPRKRSSLRERKLHTIACPQKSN